MASTTQPLITVQVAIAAPVAAVWERWIAPEDIIRWYHASDDWYTPQAENDLQPGGRFRFRMEAVDRSAGFDFTGTYTQIIHHQQIDYTIDDGRRVTVVFSPHLTGTLIEETFAAETTHSIERQRSGWQAILDQFKKYVEGR
jgi:uncharacterized protein YndB with AHSA1/START domain